MLDALFENAEMVPGFAVVIISLIIFALWLLFLERVPKHLKGIEDQLERMNNLLETQARNQATNDSIKKIVRDTVKEMKEEDKYSSCNPDITES